MPVKIVSTKEPMPDPQAGSTTEYDLKQALLGKYDETVTQIKKNPPEKVTQSEVTVQTSVSSKSNPALNQETYDKPSVVLSTKPKPMCNVGVQARQTINMGNFNSVTLGVSVHIPCEQGELNEMFDFAKLWVDTKMTGLITEVLDSKKE